MDEVPNPLKRTYGGVEREEEEVMEDSSELPQGVPYGSDDDVEDCDSMEEFDLHAYFEDFEMPWEMRVKICQSYGNYCKTFVTK